MKIAFQDEFEVDIDGILYYIEATGDREWDEDERVFTSLSKLVVTDELGNELDDNDDVYNEIREIILFSNDTRDALNKDWDEEEIPEEEQIPQYKSLI